MESVQTLPTLEEFFAVDAVLRGTASSQIRVSSGVACPGRIVAAHNIGPLEHVFLGQKGLFVEVKGPGPMFAAARYLVLKVCRNDISRCLQGRGERRCGQQLQAGRVLPRVQGARGAGTYATDRP